MRFKSYKSGSLLLLGATLFAVSCFKDLDTTPLNPNETTAATAFDNPDAYKQVLAKLYAGFATSGQQGPAGQPDIQGIDEGFSNYIRQYWKAQELTTDEAVIAWNDGTIQDYHQQDWDANSEFVTATYNRIYYQIAACNEYIRETTDAKLDSRSVSGTLRSDVEKFRAEARFIRAMCYWHALDLFRNVPMVTEADAVGAFFPRQANAEEVFNYVESELKAIESLLVPARQNEYGRADQAAAWMVLAKLYLNAQTYINRDRNTDCITYCNKVISAGYMLEPKYANMFNADNHNADGIILSINFDGKRTQTYGGTTFLCHAAVGGSMKPGDFGLDGGWGGLRVTKALVQKFPATGNSIVVAPNAGATYPVIYVPGGYQGWNPAAANQLSSKNNDNTYEGYVYLPDANSEFKFTLGPNWDNNFGDTGANGTLEPGGDNLKVADPGFYKINVNLNTLSYTLLKTTWGLIGSATPDQWNSDQNMTYNATDGAWTIQLNLTAGEVKFRANDGWDLNYGDTGKDALLEGGGDNIAIPSAGTYLIKLFLKKPDYTYSIERPLFDRRAMFYSAGQSLDIADISQFTEGYAATKFSNLKSDGTPGSDQTFVDTDFPL
ncbi:MAG: SusF/SusE family outer membrane protein, partial [Saprospiraceae bacterium]